MTGKLELWCPLIPFQIVDTYIVHTIQYTYLH